MNKLLQLICILSLSLYSVDSSAQIFKINITDYDGADADPILKALIDTEIIKVQDEVNQDLPSASPDRLMQGMANSSVMAGKGIGTDYASKMNVVLIGAGVGVGADLTKDKTTQGDISGVGVAPGLIIGANLGFLDAERILGMDTDRLNMYVNYAGYNYNHVLNDKPDKKSSIDAKMNAMGTHFRYDWIKGNDSKLFGWGGVKFHFGYEYNKTEITFKSKINQAVNTTSGGATITGTITGSPVATITSATHSIPLALSTDFQLLYFLSFYTGLGADINFGQAKGKGSVNANESTVSCSAGATCTGAGNPDIKVQPTANINGKGSVTPFTFRALAGLQFNLPWTRIFVQADKGLGNNLIAATAGLRFAF